MWTWVFSTLVLSSGCEETLTYQRFQLIREDVSTHEDVERTLASVARLVPEYHPAAHENGGPADRPVPAPYRLPEPDETKIAVASIPSAG